MGEATIRLNRLGLEQGRMWQAVLAALAILLPLVVWIGLERAIGDETTPVDPHEVQSLDSYPVAGAHLEFRVPGEDWYTPGVHFAKQRQNLTHGRTTATVEVDTGVAGLKHLLERRAEQVTGGQVGLAYTNVREYRNAASGLDGYRADLYGRDSAGSIVVVGNGDGAAATLIILAPADQLKDSTSDADGFVASFTLEGQ